MTGTKQPSTHAFKSELHILRRMLFGIVVEEKHFVLPLRSFLLDSFIHSIRLSHIKTLTECLVFLKHFPIQKTLPVPPDACHHLLGMTLDVFSGIIYCSSALYQGEDTSCGAG